MGNALRGKKIIYHRKPKPHFLGVGTDFDEAGLREDIKNTLKYAEGCSLEITFRDVQTVNGDLGRPARAVRIIRELIGK
jgi:hypothetical protein